MSSPPQSPRLVLVTAPDRQTAQKLIHTALEARLAACGNLIPSIESHYWWEGKIESSSECLILFKTVSSLYDQLEALITKSHPYDVPECISLNITDGHPPYLDWVTQSCLNPAQESEADRR